MSNSITVWDLETVPDLGRCSEPSRPLARETV